MYQTERDETSGILKKLEGDEDSVLALFLSCCCCCFMKSIINVL